MSVSEDPQGPQDPQKRSNPFATDPGESYARTQQAWAVHAGRLTQSENTSAETEDILEDLRRSAAEESQRQSMEFWAQVERAGLAQQYRAEKIAELTGQQQASQLQELDAIVRQGMYDHRVPEQNAFVSDLVNQFDQGSGGQFAGELEELRGLMQYRIAARSDAEQLRLYAENTAMPFLKDPASAPFVAGEALSGGVLGRGTNREEILFSHLNDIIAQARQQRFEPQMGGGGEAGEMAGAPRFGGGAADSDLPVAEGMGKIPRQQVEGGRFQIPNIRPEAYVGQDPEEWEAYLRQEGLGALRTALQKSGDLSPGTVERMLLGAGTLMGGMAVPIPALQGLKKAYGATKGAIGATGVTAAVQSAINQVALPDLEKNRIAEIRDPDKRARMETAAKLNLTLEAGLMVPVFQVAAKIGQLVGGGKALSQARQLLGMSGSMPAIAEAADIATNAAREATGALTGYEGFEEGEQAGVVLDTSKEGPVTTMIGGLAQILQGDSDKGQQEFFRGLLDYGEQAGSAVLAFGLTNMAARMLGAPPIQEAINPREREVLRGRLEELAGVEAERVQEADPDDLRAMGVEPEMASEITATLEATAENALPPRDDVDRLTDELGSEEAERQLERMGFVQDIQRGSAKEVSEIESVRKQRAEEADRIAAEAARSPEGPLEAAKGVRDPLAVEAARAQRAAEEATTGDVAEAARAIRDESLEQMRSGEPGAKPTFEGQMRRQMDLPARRQEGASALIGGGGKKPPSKPPGDVARIPPQPPEWKRADDLRDPRFERPEERREVGFMESLRDPMASLTNEAFSLPDPLDFHKQFLGIPGARSRNFRAWVVDTFGLPKKNWGWFATVTEQVEAKLLHANKESTTELTDTFRAIREPGVSKDVSLPGLGSKDRVFDMLNRGPEGDAWKAVAAEAAKGDERAARVQKTAQKLRGFMESMRKAAMAVDPGLQRLQERVGQHEISLAEIEKNLDTKDPAVREAIQKEREKLEAARQALYDRKKAWGKENYISHILNQHGEDLFRDAQQGRRKRRGRAAKDSPLQRPGSKHTRENKGILEQIDEAARAAGAEGILERDPETVVKRYAVAMNRYILASELRTRINQELLGVRRRVTADEATASSDADGLPNIVQWGEAEFENLGLVKNSKDQWRVVLMGTNVKGGVSPKQLEGIADNPPPGFESLHPKVAERVLTTYEGGWGTLMEKTGRLMSREAKSRDYAERSQKTLDRLEDFLQRVVFAPIDQSKYGGALDDRSRRDVDRAARQAAEDFDDDVATHKKMAKWVADELAAGLTHLPSQVVSAQLMGANPGSSWTIGAGGHFVNLTNLPGVNFWYSAQTRQAKKELNRSLGEAKLARTLQKWLRSRLGAKLAPEASERAADELADRPLPEAREGYPASGIHMEFLSEMARQVRTPQDVLAKMPPEKAKRQVWRDDAKVDLLQSGVLDVSLFDDTTLDADPAFRKHFLKTGIKKLHGLWMLNVTLPEIGVRQRAYMEAHLRAREAGKSRLEAQRAAFLFTAMTQFTFTGASQPKFLANPVGRILGTLTRWPMLYGLQETFGGKGWGQRLGRWGHKSPYTLAASIAAANLGYGAYHLFTMMGADLDHEEEGISEETSQARKDVSKMLEHANRDITNLVGIRMDEVPFARQVVEMATKLGLDPEHAEWILRQPSPIQLMPAPVGAVMPEFLGDLKDAVSAETEDERERAVGRLRMIVDPSQSKAVRMFRQWFDAEELDDSWIVRKSSGKVGRETPFTGFKQMLLDSGLPGQSFPESEIFRESQITWRSERLQRARGADMSRLGAEYARANRQMAIARAQGDEAKMEVQRQIMQQVNAEIEAMAERDVVQAAKVYTEEGRKRFISAAKRKMVREYLLSRRLKSIANVPTRKNQVQALTRAIQSGEVPLQQVARFFSTQSDRFMQQMEQYDLAGAEPSASDMFSRSRGLPLFRDAILDWIDHPTVSKEQRQALQQALVGAYASKRKAVRSGR